MIVQRLIQLRQHLGYFVLFAVAVAIFFKLPITFCAVQFGFFQLICPAGFIQTCISTKSIIVKMLPGVLVVLFTSFILGRSFCSWACPARHVGKGAKNTLKRQMPVVVRFTTDTWERLRNTVQKKAALSAGDGLAIMVGGGIGIWLFEFPVYAIFCPIGILSRNFIELITHLHLRFDLILLIFPLAFGLLFKSGWKCACPMGLIRGIAAMPNRTLQPVIDYNSCSHCDKCIRNCSFGVNLHADHFNSFSCSKCFNCLRDCSFNAIELKLIHCSSADENQLNE